MGRFYISTENPYIVQMMMMMMEEDESQPKQEEEAGEGGELRFELIFAWYLQITDFF